MERESRVSPAARLADPRIAAGAALLAGALLALPFVLPLLWPVVFVAPIPLILAAVRAASGFRAFLFGWLALTVCWMLTVPWVVTVMTTYGGLGAPVGIALYLGMALILGLYGGLFSWAVRAVRPGVSLLSWMAVPLAWSASEYARTHLLSGFPWTLLGTAVVDFRPLAHISSLAGPYALGSVLVGVATVIAWMLAGSADRRRRIRGAAVSITVLLIVLAAGFLETRARDSRRVQANQRAAMIQPNIPQEMRWDPHRTLEIFEQMVRLTRQAAERGATVVVWPESTVPLSFTSTPFYQETIESLSSELGIDIILGSVAEDAEDPASIWNSAYLVSAGETKGRYDKIRLVPFGEYVPLRKVLFFAERLVRAVGEFRFGDSSHPLSGRWSYGPAICYEVVYPRLVAAQSANGATVLVTITNDAWFGHSAAPVQHLNMVRLRAIENDRWFLRAATTGISALIDPSGRVVESLPLDREGIVFGNFQPRQRLTPYVRMGDWFAMLSCIVVVFVIVIRRSRTG